MKAVRRCVDRQTTLNEYFKVAQRKWESTMDHSTMDHCTVTQLVFCWLFLSHSSAQPCYICALLLTVLIDPPPPPTICLLCTGHYTDCKAYSPSVHLHT